nr:C-type lectin receptor-like tyrosine-protein kinase At1g52310 [Ipomoea batatas]
MGIRTDPPALTESKTHEHRKSIFSISSVEYWSGGRNKLNAFKLKSKKNSSAASKSLCHEHFPVSIYAVKMLAIWTFHQQISGRKSCGIGTGSMGSCGFFGGKKTLVSVTCHESAAGKERATNIPFQTDYLNRNIIKSIIIIIILLLLLYCGLPHLLICILIVELREKGILLCMYVRIGMMCSCAPFVTTNHVILNLLLFRSFVKRRKRSRAALALVPPSWKIFTREEIKSITKNFSEGNRLIGDAKTGGTYSGVLPDGSRVAVKRLKRSGFQRKKEFYSEIGRVARLHHPNLVAIKGCCYHHSDRYIVYEFVANGPLDRWLHHIPRGGRCLDWTMRMKIATTLAQGIAFLHDKVKPQVVHRDIRASNVLLDEDFGAHLMGVGLSKFVPWEVMHERRVMAGGTYGYLAPEFVYRNELTTKSDVYSFGVLLLEIVSGRRPAQAVDSVGWQSIFEWATPLVQAHRYVELLDPLISSSSSSQIPEVGVVQKVVDLVYSCTQHVPSMRPRMSHIVHQLQQLAQPPIVK